MTTATGITLCLAVSAALWIVIAKLALWLMESVPV